MRKQQLFDLCDNAFHLFLPNAHIVAVLELANEATLSMKAVTVSCVSAKIGW